MEKEAESKFPKESTLYVGDLDEEITKEQLENFFSNYGIVKKVKIFRDKITQRSKGYAFVHFLIPEDAQFARKEAQYQRLGYKYIRILFKDEEIDFPPNSNLMVHNLDPGISMRELHDFFEKIGEVACVKITNHGTAYVQYQKMEDAQKALKVLNYSKIKNNILTLSISDENKPSKRNLYIKHLPKGIPKDEIELMIVEVFSKYGTIESTLVEKNPKLDEYFGFVCFSNYESAKNALEDLQKNPITLRGAKDQLFVSWYESKEERKKNDDRSNLYLRNLKLLVNEELLKARFDRFGKIKSILVKEWCPDGKTPQSKFAYCAFFNTEDAEKAVKQGPKIKDIQELFLNSNEVFITYHLTKEKRKEQLHKGHTSSHESNATKTPSHYNMQLNLNSKPFTFNSNKSEISTPTLQQNKLEYAKFPTNQPITKSQTPMDERYSMEIEEYRSKLILLVSQCVGDSEAYSIVDKILKNPQTTPQTLKGMTSNQNFLEKMIDLYKTKG